VHILVVIIINFSSSFHQSSDLLANLAISSPFILTSKLLFQVSFFVTSCIFFNQTGPLHILC